jgi:ABC transporter substrate binding protein
VTRTSHARRWSGAWRRSRRASPAICSNSTAPIGRSHRWRSGEYHWPFRPGAEVAAKRLQLLKLAVPTTSRVAILWNPDNPSHAAYLDEWKAAAPALGVEMLFVAVRSSDEFDSAFAAMMRERPDAFTMIADFLHQLHIGWIIDFLARNRLPGMYLARENVVAGGLMSYGASFPDLFRRAAGYVHKILQGARPADLPVEQPTKFDLTVNLKTAKALGLTIPEVLKMQINKSDRNDAAGIARIMQTGWFKEVRVKDLDSHSVRALVRHMPSRIRTAQRSRSARLRLENARRS